MDSPTPPTRASPGSPTADGALHVLETVAEQPAASSQSTFVIALRRFKSGLPADVGAAVDVSIVHLVDGELLRRAPS